MTISDKIDELFNRADALFKQYNPCQIERKDFVVTCIGTREQAKRLGESNFYSSYIKENTLCCTSCAYYNQGNGFWTIAGCSALKPLGCKMYICQYVKHKTFLREFSKIQVEVGKIEMRYRCYKNKVGLLLEFYEKMKTNEFFRARMKKLGITE